MLEKAAAMPKPQRTLNPEHVADAIRRYNMVGFNNHNFFEVDELGPAYCKAHLNTHETSLNIMGGVHGGAIATLCDIVTFLAVYADLDEDEGFTSLDLNVSFVRTPAPGILRGEGTLLRRGKTVSLAEALIYDSQDKLVAHATEKIFTAKAPKLMPMKKALELRDPDTPLPPKYLD